MAGTVCICLQAVANFQWRLVGTVVALWLFGFIMMSVVKSFGVLIDEIVFQLRSDLGTIGMIVGLFQGIPSFLGPLVDVSLKYLTLPGIVAIGLLGGSSLCASAFATNVWQIATLMIFSGTGSAFVTLPALVRFMEHVPPEKFAFVFSIAITGHAVGIVVGPMVAEFLTETYGWRGTILLLGGMYLNIPLLLFMMTSSVGQTINRLASWKARGEDEANMAGVSTNSKDCPSCSLLQQSPDCPPPSGDVGADIDACVSDTCTKTSERLAQIKDHLLPSASYEEDTVPPVERKSNDDTNDLKTLNGNFNHEHVEEELSFQFRYRAFLAIRNTFLGTTIAEEPYFLLFYCKNIINGFAFTAWIVFLIPHGLFKGYPLARSVFLASFGGIGNILGRLLPGPILHMRWLSAIDLMIALQFINSVVLLLDPFVSPFWLLSFNAFLGGFAFGSNKAMAVIVIKESYPAHKLSSAIALSGFAFAIGQPLGGFLTGWLADTVGYDKAFMCVGIAEIVGCVLLITFRHYYNRRQV